jgi:hypothetical protein
MKLSTYGPFVNQDSPSELNPNLTAPIENVNIVSTTPTGTLNIDVLTSGFWVFTTATAANFTLNLRGNANTTLGATLGIGQSITVVTAFLNGTTAYYLSGFDIDGTSITPIWLNASAPSFGNASSTDVYSFTVLKTGTSTYKVFASGPSTFA